MLKCKQMRDTVGASWRSALTVVEKALCLLQLQDRSWHILRAACRPDIHLWVAIMFEQAYQFIIWVGEAAESEHAITSVGSTL